MAQKNLFISHSVKDTKLASIVAELLQGSISVSPENIIKTALNEAGIPDGEDLISYIRSKTGTPDCVVVLLTRDYLTSRFCLCELGACWALSQNIVPLLVPPLLPKHVKELFADRGLIRIDDPDDMNRFVMQVKEQLDIEEVNLPRWAVEKKRFIDTVKGLVK